MALGPLPGIELRVALAVIDLQVLEEILVEAPNAFRRPDREPVANQQPGEQRARLGRGLLRRDANSQREFLVPPKIADAVIDTEQDHHAASPTAIKRLEVIRYRRVNAAGGYTPPYQGDGLLRRHEPSGPPPRPVQNPRRDELRQPF